MEHLFNRKIRVQIKEDLLRNLPRRKAGSLLVISQFLLWKRSEYSGT